MKKNIFATKKQKIASVWVAYLWLVLALFVTCQLICASLQWEGMNHFPAQMHRLCDALLLALPLLLIPRRWLMLPWLAVINIYFLANLWYYRNYGAFIPMSQILKFSALNGLGTSIVESMRWRDILLPLPSVAWCVWLCCVRLKRHWRPRLILFVISLIFIAVEVFPSYKKYPSDDERNPRVMYRNLFPKAYKKYGLAEYWWVQAHVSKGYSKAEMNEVKDWMSYRSTFVPELEATAEGRNLIVIVVESLSSWMVGHQVEGTPVTPNLDRLLADSTTLYIPNCLTQVRWGRSSDCHLMLETGLLPMMHHVTADECGSNFYYSLPKALKERGYRAETYVCDDKTSWWHQEENYAAYGFDHTTDMLGSPTGEVNYDTCDQFLFPLALRQIRQLPEPFYAKVITLSMHNATPMPQHDTPLQRARLDSDRRNHLIRTHYTDHHLGLFLDSLRACGLYQRSLIVITGDHMRLEAGHNPWESVKDNQLDSSYFVPFIVLNAPTHPADPHRVCGQVDLYPTLLDLMGVGRYEWRGLGISLFDPTHPGCATHHIGITVGPSANDSIAAYQRSLYRVSDIILRSDYFSKHPLK